MWGYSHCGAIVVKGGELGVVPGARALVESVSLQFHNSVTRQYNLREGIRQEQLRFARQQYRRPVRQPILKSAHVAQGSGAKGGGGGVHDARAARHLAAIISATHDADVPVRTSQWNVVSAAASFEQRTPNALVKRRL